MGSGWRVGPTRDTSIDDDLNVYSLQVWIWRHNSFEPWISDHLGEPCQLGSDSPHALLQKCLTPWCGPLHLSMLLHHLHDLRLRWGRCMRNNEPDPTIHTGILKNVNRWKCLLYLSRTGSSNWLGFYRGLIMHWSVPEDSSNCHSQASTRISHPLSLVADLDLHFVLAVLIALCIA